nr:immunoglobulin light chain junction region [Macaca mulatta]
DYYCQSYDNRLRIHYIF